MSSRLALLLLWAVAAHADDFSVDGKASSLTFHMKHKLHKFDGVSRAVEGLARLTPEGVAQVAVRARVESFDTSNVNRDAHMKEVMEAARFPVVGLKATTRLSPPNQFPSTVESRWQAELTLHGVSQRLELPVKLIWDSADRVRAEAQLTVSLEAYGIERPSLMFAKVEDALPVDARLVFVRQVTSRGVSGGR